MQDLITAGERLTTAELVDPIMAVLVDPIIAEAEPLLPRKEADMETLGPGMAAMVGAKTTVSNSADLLRLTKGADMETLEATTTVVKSKTAAAKTLLVGGTTVVARVLAAMFEAMETLEAAMKATLPLSIEPWMPLAVD